MHDDRETERGENERLERTGRKEGGEGSACAQGPGQVK